MEYADTDGNLPRLGNQRLSAGRILIFDLTISSEARMP